MDSLPDKPKSQPEPMGSPEYPAASLDALWPERAAWQSRLPKMKSVLIFISITTLALLLPVAILPAILFLSRRIGVDTSDPFIYFAILASLLPGILLILLPRVRLLFKVLGAVLYTIVGYPIMIIYAFVLFCVMFGECL
jgi:hypothetical protein